MTNDSKIDLRIADARKRAHVTEPKSARERWWRYIVIRGDGLPARLDGMWYDLDAMDARLPGQWGGADFEATNQWEQRGDGAVAVVYRLRTAGRGSEWGGGR